MERVQPLEENVGNVSRLRFWRNKLLLVASVIQWLGLLLCLTYICLHYYTPQVSQLHPQYHSIQRIRVEFTRCDDEKGFILMPANNQDTMKVEDNSIIIKCDGYYLISLKGFFSQAVSLSLLYRQGREPLIYKTNTGSIKAITVAYLGFKDRIYLNVTTPKNSCEDLKVNGGELILIQQNPGEYCAQ